ncbi:SgcJ/EcaC family oxidoreductase [Serratia microhaemolytica]|uniref:SgcJ/EcaC family oxidoreductase n=1 Tax=Serratia microhaemolytica TaxID=2675110 RepID=UPI000FDDE391|nr:SgcJ/EcaC family oxidoreductase [Serratia microhaemolytica]
MKEFVSLVIPLTLFSASSLATETHGCANATPQQIAALFERWNSALMTSDAVLVAQHYLSDAVLLPTVSNQVRLTDAERIDYFEHFLEKSPVGQIDSRTIRIGCNTAIDTGTYSFVFKDQSKVSARYTFTYAWDGSEWKISSHHSSVMPEH